MRALTAAKLAIGAAFTGSAAYVHLRGKVRHKLLRQLTDHSTFLAPYTTLVTAFSAVPRTPILAVNDFPELAPLRDSWEVIRDEARQLYEGSEIRAAPKYNDIAFNTFFRRGWKRFYVKWYGEPLPSARALCPKTVALVESIPSVNAALFAVLAPRSRLGEHRDPFAGSVRYHLGLITPNSDGCRIYIDGTPYSWRDGQDIVFDETYIHSAINDTDESRIILFCDIARPITNGVVREINRFVTRHVVKITAAQNTEAEQVGILNGVSGYVYALKTRLERLKKTHRHLYYVGKYTILGGLLYAVIFRGLRRSSVAATRAYGGHRVGP